MKVVVVTGFAGFIGRHACRVAAEHGMPVVAVGTRARTDRGAEPPWPLRTVEEPVSVSALEQATDGMQPVAIIHCAGTGTVRRATDAPHSEFVRTVGGTAELLEFVRTRPGPKPRVVLASSAAVYGETGPEAAPESRPCRPISVYGFHKLMAEQACQSYSGQFAIPVTVVRLFSVYGPGLRKQLPWDALSRLRSGDRRFDCTGEELRDWLHVVDAARLLWRAAVHEQPSWHVVNGAGQRATTGEVINTLSELSGAALRPTFTGTPQPSNPTHLIGCAAEAGRTLGWQHEVPLRDGLAEFVAWCDGETEAA